MSKRIVAYSLTLVIFMAALHTAGRFFPSGLNWGFHALGFLPFPVFGGYVLLLLFGLRYIVRGNVDRLLDQLATLARRRPKTLVALTALVVVALSCILRIRVPLLGDSYVLLKNLTNTIKGVHELNTGLEPLAVVFFYWVVKLFGQVTYPEVLTAFWLGEIPLLLGFLVCTWLVVRELFQEERSRILALVFALVFPYMQLFFGYLEIYSAVLFIHSVYALVVIGFLRRDRAFTAVTAVFLLEGATHYLSLVLLAPSYAYLISVQYRRGGLRKLAPAFGLIVATIVAVLTLVDFDPARLLPGSDHPHYLSFTQRSDGYQAYPFFSPYHLVDILNYVALVAPAGIFLVVIGVRNAFRSRIDRFFVLVLGPVAGFLVVAKFDMPLAADWDIAASFFYFTALWGTFITLREHAETPAVRVMAAAILITALTSAIFWILNASTEPALARAKSLLDHRIASREGSYQLTIHLTEYYSASNGVDSIIPLYQAYQRAYPNDPRAYVTLIPYMVDRSEGRELQTASLFGRLMDLSPNELSVKEPYLRFCLDAGQRLVREGDSAAARLICEQAWALGPSTSPACNSLGILFRDIGQPERAITCFTKSLALDPKYTMAQLNLANVYGDLGYTTRALELYRKVIDLQPGNANAYWNMGVNYFAAGDSSKGWMSIRKAILLGKKVPEGFVAGPDRP